MRCIAIIPARGGSKRLPRKNVLMFRGRPIIAYTIDAAIESGVFERVIVSTEDEEIAGIAERGGAEVSRRDAGLATDAARVVDVCLSELSRAEETAGAWDAFACLYPTAPLRNAEDIRKTAALLGDGADFAMAVTTYDLPPHQALRVDGDGFLVPNWPELVTRRDSEIGRLLVDNGSTYAARVGAFRKQRSFYGAPLRGHEMPRSRSVDINTADDFAMAEFLSARMEQAAS